MFKTIVPAALALAVLSAPFAASAAECTAASQDQWKSADVIKAEAVGMGYDVRQVKVERGCYEVYGIKDGNKAEMLFDPVTGKLVSASDND